MNVSGISNKAITPKKIKKMEKRGERRASNLAYLGSSVGGLATLPVALTAVSGLKAANKNLSAGDKSQLLEAANKVLDLKGLAEKGVKLVDLRKSESGEFLLSSLDSLPISDKFRKAFKKLYEMTLPEVATAAGNNAFFGGVKGAKNAFGGRLYANEVVVNMDKLPTAVFHEFGHAFNANKSVLWKGIQSLRSPAMLVASSLAMFAAFTKNAKPTEENNGELTKGQKVKNFVRKNAGGLAFASMLPVLAEEGMATIRGNKWAKEFLSPELAKKVGNGNKVAYLSYLAAAVGLGLTAHLASKIKDSLVAKNEAKINQLKENL